MTTIGNIIYMLGVCYFTLTCITISKALQAGASGPKLWPTVADFICTIAVIFWPIILGVGLIGEIKKRR